MKASMLRRWELAILLFICQPGFGRGSSALRLNGNAVAEGKDFRMATSTVRKGPVS